MQKAPKGERIIIVLLGRRNVGKSSLINALVGQEIALVSDIPGTTTDPVDKHYELLPLGPVTFYDTAGLDDVGELGEMRIKATKRVLMKADLALLVTDEKGLGEEEFKIIGELEEKKIPFIVVFNKIDLGAPREEDINFCTSKGIPFALVSANRGDSIDRLKDLIIKVAPYYLKR